MTCIVGLLSDGYVTIGADSLGSDGWTGSEVHHPKVFKVGDFIIGGTTSFRMLDLLEYSLVIPDKRPWADEDMEKFMRTVFVDCIRTCLKNGGFAEKNKEAESGGNFLVGYKDMLWQVQSDYSVLSHGEYDSVGSGLSVAMGSLFSTAGTKMKAEDRVIKALEAAAHHICSVKGPFTLLNTKEK